VDILEMERSQKRISEGAYRVGREIQAAYETRGRSSSDWLGSSGGDPTTAQELRQLGNVQRAQAAVALEKRITAAVGAMGAKHIHRVLGEGWSYRDIAGKEGRSGDRGVTQVATRFRQLLEDVTEHFAAKGRP
jgi:hypothetical protein